MDCPIKIDLTQKSFLSLLLVTGIIYRFKMMSGVTGVCLETQMVDKEEANQLLKIEEYPLFVMGQVHTYYSHIMRVCAFVRVAVTNFSEIANFLYYV